MTTPSFNIAADATATFAAGAWLANKTDDGTEVAEADVDETVGAVWFNGVDEALIQTNEVFLGARTIAALVASGTISAGTISSGGTVNVGTAVSGGGSLSGGQDVRRLYKNNTTLAGSTTTTVITINTNDLIAASSAAMITVMFVVRRGDSTTNTNSVMAWAKIRATRGTGDAVMNFVGASDPELLTNWTSHAAVVTLTTPNILLQVNRSISGTMAVQCSASVQVTSTDSSV